MARTALTAFLVLSTLLLGGCGLFSGTRPAGKPTAPAAMPLTEDNVAMVRAAVTKAKAAAPKPEDPDAYRRYARQVYVGSWTGNWSAQATTDAALAAARTGSDPAREYLTIMVYDIQLTSAMEGVALSPEDWRAVYVGAGVMTDAAFTRYAALSRNNKVMP
ncbi:conserved hypothetical protein [Solidesulfovibrio fructosivorans JJ]]|uniref:Lipoprotein n=1 Tax=Solidesulfovibrio fructosivorans JJ] TaxID=596151 RepID=E1K0E8_SOLFR|nr:hypothetical protein [Solidesulfovibrio fructosivorans]EFL49891.1 conserved hypothetical protein [Solidesulfovibrio fructosivorans JJ]]